MTLSGSLDDQEIIRLRAFSSHFLEFWANWEEIRPTEVVSYGFRLRQDGRVDADQDLHISRFRLKGFLADYRKFHLNKEPTNFLSICNILSRRCTDSRFRAALENCRVAWKHMSTYVVGWHNDYSPDDFMDAYFNDSVFHSDGARSLRLNEIRETLTEKAILFGAYDIAWHRLLQIRNVNWLIDPFLRGEGVFRVPAKQ